MIIPKKSRLTNTTKMSGKIYAKDLEKIFPIDEKDIGEGNPEIFDKLSDKVVIDLQNAMIEQFLDKKTQLIKFLEDKIKEYQEELSNSWMEDEENDFSFELKIKIEMLKEVLDFVEKGGK